MSNLDGITGEIKFTATSILARDVMAFTQDPLRKNRCNKRKTNKRTSKRKNGCLRDQREEGTRLPAGSGRCPWEKSRPSRYQDRRQGPSGCFGQASRGQCGAWKKGPA